MGNPLLEELKLEHGITLKFPINSGKMSMVAYAHLYSILTLRIVEIINAYWEDFTEPSFIRIAHYCPVLTKLCLNNCDSATADCVKEVLEYCSLADNCPILHTVSSSGVAANLLSVVQCYSKLRTLEVNYGDGELFYFRNVRTFIKISYNCDYCAESQKLPRLPNLTRLLLLIPRCI